MEDSDDDDQQKQWSLNEESQRLQIVGEDARLEEAITSSRSPHFHWSNH